MQKSDTSVPAPWDQNFHRTQIKLNKKIFRRKKTWTKTKSILKPYFSKEILVFKSNLISYEMEHFEPGFDPLYAPPISQLMAHEK